MARNENPPFGRGEYDTNDLSALAGKTWVFEDLDYSSSGVKGTRTSNFVECMLVKNNSGIALLPKLRAVLKKTAGDVYKEVDGYARLLTDWPAAPIDEWLPAAGVPDQAYFWVVKEGPATVTTAMANMGADIAVGDRVVAATAAASTFSTTAGRVEDADLTGATLILADNIRNVIGVAMSARTTTGTNAALLISVTRW